MTDQKRFRILDDPRAELVFDLADELSRLAGDGPYDLPLPSLQTPSLELFDRLVGLEASLAPRAGIAGRGVRAEGLFGEASSLVPPEGSSLAELALDAAVGLDLQQNVEYGLVKVSAQASAGGKLAYRHVTPVSQAKTRLEGLAHLATTSRLPQLARIGAVPAATVHRLEALLYLDFGLTARVGQDFEISLAREVFEGLPAVFSVKGTASARAAFGVGLYESMVVAVGRGDASSTNPEWVRIRLERESRRRFSFGLMVEVQAKYDLGSSLAPIIARAFDHIPPLPRAVESFAEVNRLAAEGDWAAVVANLSDELADTLSEWLDGTGWREWAAGSPQVEELIAVSQQVVEAYQGLGPRLQSWWDHLLGATRLEVGTKGRDALERVAGLDADDLDLGALISDRNAELGEVVDLVEALSGQSLEEILLRPDSQARALLATASEQAGRILSYLTDTPAAVLARLQGFAERTGLGGTIDFLAANATSLDDVEGYVSQRVRALAGRWVGKAADELTVADRKRVQQIAQRIQRVLAAPEALEKKLQDAAAKLKGEVGFSLSLEIDRLSQTQAVIDVEVDPADAHDDLHRRIEGALRGGSVAEVLQALEGALRDLEEREDQGGKNLALPFVLRQCVFQSRRVRTSAVSTMLQITGLGGLFHDNRRTVRQRIEETELVVEEIGSSFFRSATYGGGYVRTEILNKVTDRTGYWLIAGDAGGGVDRSKPFDATDAQELALQVSFFHEDLAVHTRALRGLDALLADLGFLAGDSAFADLQLSDQSRMRLAINLRFPRPAVEAFLANLTPTSWNEHYLQAGRRWFDERSVWVPAEITAKSSQGQVLKAITASGLFRSKWTVGSKDFIDAVPLFGLSVSIEGKTREARIVEPSGGGKRIRQPYLPLKVLIDHRSRGLRRQRRLATTFATAASGRTDAAYRSLIAEAARAWAGTLAANNNWPSTLFGLWLFLARLTAIAPDTLVGITGVASLRWKEPTEDEWNGPRGWRLEGGARPFVAR